ncbi:hypothetical protein ACLOJK_009295 [Asimina triloba]
MSCGVIFLLVAPKRISFFSMHRVFSNHQVLVRHPWRHEQSYDEEDDGGGDDILANDEQGTHQGPWEFALGFDEYISSAPEKAWIRCDSTTSAADKPNAAIGPQSGHEIMNGQRRK